MYGICSHQEVFLRLRFHQQDCLRLRFYQQDCLRLRLYQQDCLRLRMYQQDCLRLRLYHSISWFLTYSVASSAWRWYTSNITLNLFKNWSRVVHRSFTIYCAAFAPSSNSGNMDVKRLLDRVSGEAHSSPVTREITSSHTDTVTLTNTHTPQPHQELSRGGTSTRKTHSKSDVL